MIERPRLKGYLTVVPQDATTFVVHGTEGELWRLRFDEARSDAFRRLLPLLDGEHDLDALCAQAADASVPADRVRRLIEGLESASIVEEGADGIMTPSDRARFREQLLFFSRFSAARDGAQFQARLLASSVDVVRSGALSDSIVRALEASGVGRVQALEADRGLADRIIAGPPADLLVVPVESWDPSLLEALNDAALATGRPWMLVQQRGAAEGFVGPLFVPGQTACYMCLESRIRANLALVAEYDALREYLRLQRGPGRPWGGLAPGADILAGIAVVEIVKHLTGFAPPRLLGRFCSVNWFTWTNELHEVLRLPRCPFCRPPKVETFPWGEIPQAEPEPEAVR